MKLVMKTSQVARIGVRREGGFSLIELLVSLAIGAILIFGATQAYVDSRNAYGVNETAARMQETARFALSIMESDVRMANYWGLIKGAESISGKASQQGSQSALGGNAATVCGKNFGIDLEADVEGTDNGYTATCQAKNNNPVDRADTLTIRRASYVPSDTTTASGPLRVCSSRTAGVLVTDITGQAICDAASATPATAQINDLIVNMYYVDKDSDSATGVPSLRRKYLLPTSTFDDAEITPYVEDMQIQYGVDTSGGMGINSGSATRYLDAGSTLNTLLQSTSSPAQIVTVRVWLLVRSDTPEVGFTDTRVYEYGNRLAANGTKGDLATLVSGKLPAYQPSLSTDNSPTSPKHYRRILVSRTFQLRNALGT